jgi:uncharacterized membrane protein
VTLDTDTVTRRDIGGIDMAKQAAEAVPVAAPARASVPVDLFAFSLGCDALFIWGDANPVWLTLTLYAVAAGIVGTLLACGFGLAGLAALPPSAAKRIAVRQTVIALAVVPVFAASLWLRLGGMGGPVVPSLLSLIGVCALAVRVRPGWT